MLRILTRASGVLLGVGATLLGGCGFDPNGSKPFRALLSQAGLEFQAAPNLEPLGTVENDRFAVEHALRHRQVDLEIRYAIRPIQLVEIEYTNPHATAPPPNDLYPLLFESLIQRVAGPGSAPRRILPAVQAQDEFGADWAAVSVFSPRVGFGGAYEHCMLLALHRHELADAYVFFLFDDKGQAMPAIRESLHALRFSTRAPTVPEASG